MILWLYIYEPRTGRKLLAVVRGEAPAQLYWRMNAERDGARPFNVAAGSPRWREEQRLARGESTTFGDVRITFHEDGRLLAEGQEARGQRYAQLFKKVECGMGEPPQLAEVWG